VPAQQPAQTQPQQPTQPTQVKPLVPVQQPAQTQPQQPTQPAKVTPSVPAQQPAQTQPQQPQQPANAQPQQPNTPANAATQPRNTPAAVIAPPWCNPRPGTMGCSLPPSMQKPIEPKRNGPPAIVVITDKGEVKTIGQLRDHRSESREGDFTIIREPDRTIWVDKKGQIFIQHDDIDRFRYGARDVRVDRQGDDTLSTISLPNGERVVTTFGAHGRMLRRSRILPDGREIVLIDQRPQSIDYDYVVNLPPPTIRIPRDRYIVNAAVASEQTIYDALMAMPIEKLERPYSLDEVRQSVTVRERMSSVDVDTINFELGSWEVAPGQVVRLSAIADALKRALTANPQEIFLIEGHTDAVGNDVDNMSLSDRRAETVALIMSQRYAVPAENLVTQGYGRQFPLIQATGAERRNRRVTVRRITPLLAGPQ
jgi:outer membrane protein OmpA-like peptidoglycan-associated protein